MPLALSLVVSPFLLLVGKQRQASVRKKVKKINLNDANFIAVVTIEGKKKRKKKKGKEREIKKYSLAST